MKYWETGQTIPLPWGDVACGYWWRYPNPRSQHVFSVDTLETRVEGDKLYAKRLIMKTNPLPSWGKHFFNVRRVAVIEEVEVDRGQKELVWYTRNIGLTVFMATVERVTLSLDETSPAETSVRKQCWIDSSIMGFRSAIKKFGVDRYKKNCGPATNGMQLVIEEKFAKDKLARLALSETVNTSSCEVKSDQCDTMQSQVTKTSANANTGQIYEAVKLSLCDKTQEIT